MISFQLSWSRLTAIALTILASTLDQVAWDWQRRLMASCTSRHLVQVDILFSLPFLLLLLAQLLLLYLPLSRRMIASAWILSALLIGYIPISVIMWKDEVWDTEVIQQCMYSVTDNSNLLPYFLHWFLMVPCGIYFIVAAALAIRQRLRLKAQ